MLVGAAIGARLTPSAAASVARPPLVGPPWPAVASACAIAVASQAADAGGIQGDLVERQVRDHQRLHAHLSGAREEALRAVGEHRVHVGQQDERDGIAVRGRQFEDRLRRDAGQQRLVRGALDRPARRRWGRSGDAERDDVGAGLEQRLDEPVARGHVRVAAGQVGQQRRALGARRCEGEPQAGGERWRRGRWGLAGLRRAVRVDALERHHPSSSSRCAASWTSLSPRPDRLTITRSPVAKRVPAGSSPDASPSIVKRPVDDGDGAVAAAALGPRRT